MSGLDRSDYVALDEFAREFLMHRRMQVSAQNRRELIGLILHCPQNMQERSEVWDFLALNIPKHRG